jgi:hypothetical protein
LRRNERRGVGGRESVRRTGKRTLLRELAGAPETQRKVGVHSLHAGSEDERRACFEAS